MDVGELLLDVGPALTDAGFDALRAASLLSTPVRGRILGCLTRF